METSKEDLPILETITKLVISLQNHSKSEDLMEDEEETTTTTTTTNPENLMEKIDGTSMKINNVEILNTLQILPRFGAALKELTIRNATGIIPKCISQFSRTVTQLSFSSCQIQQLPEWIQEFTSLEKLEIENSNFEELPSTMSSFVALKTLSLSSTTLKQIPTNIEQLTLLENLTVAQNSLTELPTTIGNLSSLKLLQLNVNRLTQLPETICQLSLLKKLDLSDNSFPRLPSTIGQLSLLEELLLEKINLEQLPDSIGKLSSLITLNLSNNQLTHLPNSFGELTSLEFLNLSKNRLTELPWSIGNLTSLKSFYLSNNQLTTFSSTISQSLGRLTSLIVLDLSTNKLEAIPTHIMQFRPNSTEKFLLKLSHNQLKTLPSSMCRKFCQILVLEIHPNPFEYYPFWLTRARPRHPEYIINNVVDDPISVVFNTPSLVNLCCNTVVKKWGIPDEEKSDLDLVNDVREKLGFECYDNVCDGCNETFFGSPAVKVVYQASVKRPHSWGQTDNINIVALYCSAKCCRQLSYKQLHAEITEWAKNNDTKVVLPLVYGNFLEAESKLVLV